MGNGPTLVRYADRPYLTRPGLHSHNRQRGFVESRTSSRALRVVRTILLVFGLCAVGYYCYSLCDQYVYQAYENWAFDQQIAGRKAVSFADYVREQTPFGFLSRSGHPVTASSPQGPTLRTAERVPAPQQGSVLGRVSIGRLNVSAMVREGVDAQTLKLAVGHVPSTALPGQVGNFAIAAHRDTLFRALKDIRKGDSVTFQSPTKTYQYQVVSTEIVKPSETSVLQPEGDQKLLTMITCYPFYYVGAAPKRFIVQAKLVSADPGPAPSVAHPQEQPAATNAGAATTSTASREAGRASRVHAFSFEGSPKPE